MGGDGGSIPGRYDVVKVKGYEFKRNLGGMGYDPNTIVRRGRSADENPDSVFAICHLTQEPLCPPVCIDKQGYPYSKEKVIEALRGARKLPPNVKIRKMKDVIQIYPRSNQEGVFPAFDTSSHSLQCQLTGDPCTTKRSFYFSTPCGCIYSSKALGNMKTTEGRCPVCSEPDATRFPIFKSQKREGAAPY